MFCPVCRDEYRPGFTRCATCDVDLVETLDAAAPSVPAPTLGAEAIPDEPTINFCGFLSLEDALHARVKLREAKLTAEILIRNAPAGSEEGSAQDEYWLRVRPKDFPAAEKLIGFEHAATAGADDSFRCSACGALVHASDAACPGCGLRFEE